MSSDRGILQAARRSGSPVVSSAEFARTAIASFRAGSPQAAQGLKPSHGELQEWLKLFNDRGPKFGQF